MKWFIIILLEINILSFGLGAFDKLDRYIFSCRTTDFECFKRQYVSLRDNILLGNRQVDIDDYSPYCIQYDSGTCLKISGFEESTLSGISMQSHSHTFTITLELPVRISQVITQDATRCDKPKEPFSIVSPSTKGELKKFMGNATIKAVFPYELKRIKGQVYLHLQEEDLDVALDIPDLRHYIIGNEEQKKMYELSEWAYDVVQQIDMAWDVAHPYLSRMRTVTEWVPLEALILLYPFEEFTDIDFTYGETDLLNLTLIN